ncbi:hypothetical protein D3C73_1226960 [compost metagenome]
MATPFVQDARRGHRHARVQRQDALAVDQQRVDVQRAHFGNVCCQLRQLDQRQRQRALVGRWHITVGLEDA